MKDVFLTMPRHCGRRAAEDMIDAMRYKQEILRRFEKMQIGVIYIDGGKLVPIEIVHLGEKGYSEGMIEARMINDHRGYDVLRRFRNLFGGCPTTDAFFGTPGTKKAEIKEVIFNNPATIVQWSDGSETVVICQDNLKEVKKVVDGKEVTVMKPQKSQTYNKETGLAMCIAKKYLGNKGNYNDVFKKWIKED